HRAARHLVGVLAGQHMGKGRLARSVRAHNGVDLALVHGEVEPFEDLAAVHRDMEVFDFKHCQTFSSFYQAVVLVSHKLKCAMISAISSLFLAASSPPCGRPSDLPPTSISPCSPITMASPSEKCPSSGRCSTSRAPSNELSMPRSLSLREGATSTS